MAQYTIFNLTLPDGQPLAVGFPRDFVSEHDLAKGELVRIVPGGGSFKVSFDILPYFEDVVTCRIVSMNKQVVCEPIWNNVPREVWFLYLASTDVAGSLH